MKYGVVDHFSHPHMLQRQNSNRLYTCDGCKEHGFSKAYRCDGCSYDLHKECTRERSFTISHHFFDGYTFEFLDSPPGDRVCDACGRDIKGFVYHCWEKGWDLHPCCAELKRVIKTEDQVELHLSKKIYSRCTRCGVKKIRKGVNGWSYVSRCNQFHFHVACIKDIMEETCAKDCFENDGQITESGRALMIPSRELVRYDSGERGMKFTKYWKIAIAVIKSVISIFLGDPVSPVVELVAAILQSG